MKLPTELFLEGISPGQIYYFSSDKINTNVPHYFVCLTIAEEIVLFVCCTSQFKKRESFLERRSLPNSTLVWIKPKDENGFKVDTFVDCNKCIDYRIDELKQLYENNKIDYMGRLSESDFDQILNGIKDSPLIEEITKDTLPSIDDY